MTTATQSTTSSVTKGVYFYDHNAVSGGKNPIPIEFDAIAEIADKYAKRLGFISDILTFGKLYQERDDPMTSLKAVDHGISVIGSVAGELGSGFATMLHFYSKGIGTALEMLGDLSNDIALDNLWRLRYHAKYHDFTAADLSDLRGGESVPFSLRWLASRSPTLKELMPWYAGW